MVLRAENLWQQARVMIGEATQRTQGYQKLQEDAQAQIVRQISARLISTFDVMKLMDVLAEELPRLHIVSSYVALYDNPDALTDQARLILAYNEQGRASLGTEGRMFPSQHLVPAGFLPQGRRYSMVIMPLYFERHLGFALFEVGPREGNIYGVLSGQISSALQGALLVQRVSDPGINSPDRVDHLFDHVNIALDNSLFDANQHLLRQRRRRQKVPSVGFSSSYTYCPPQIFAHGVEDLGSLNRLSYKIVTARLPSFSCSVTAPSPVFSVPE
jgi:hypothetical protein